MGRYTPRNAVVAIAKRSPPPSPPLMKIRLFTSLLALPFVFALTGCATPYQLMADREVDSLCEKEGGVFIYERVGLPSSYYFNEAMSREYQASYGNLIDLKLRQTYRITIDQQEVKSKHGEPIYRTREEVWRKRDGKLLGFVVSFSHRTDEPTVPFSGYAHGCAEFEGSFRFPLNHLLTKLFYEVPTK